MRDRLRVHGFHSPRSHFVTGFLAALSSPAIVAKLQFYVLVTRPSLFNHKRSHTLPKNLGTAIRIIIAEGHAIVRDGLRRLLASEEDFAVVGEAGDGEHAIYLAQQLKPDILLLDLAMPRKPGMQTLREITELRLPVHVILLTAAIHPFEVTRALQLGARGVILKASQPELLLKSIRAAYKGQPWVASEVLSDCARSPEEPTGAPALTSREIEIVSAIRSGSSNREIAQKLSISEKTVKLHLTNIFRKLGVCSRLELGCWLAATTWKKEDTPSSRESNCKTGRECLGTPERIYPLRETGIYRSEVPGKLTNRFCLLGRRGGTILIVL